LLENKNFNCNCIVDEKKCDNNFDEIQEKLNELKKDCYKF